MRKDSGEFEYQVEYKPGWRTGRRRWNLKPPCRSLKVFRYYRAATVPRVGQQVGYCSLRPSSRVPFPNSNFSLTGCGMSRAASSSRHRSGRMKG